MKLKLSEDKTKILIVESTHEEFHQLKLHLTRKVEGAHFKKLYKMGVWNGQINHFHEGIINYGLWKEILNCCKEHNYKFEIDNSTFPFDLSITQKQVDDFCDDFYKNHRVEPTETNPEGLFTPYEHQRKAVFNILKYRYCCIESATASGKSLIFATFLFYILSKINKDYKTLIIVPRIDLISQLYDDLKDYKNGFNSENINNKIDLKIEEIYSDKPRKVRDGEIPNLYIGTYQSLVKYNIEFLSQFDIVACDEAHLCKASSLKDILSKTFKTAKYRFGLSGTYYNPESCEILTVQSLLGPIVFRVLSRELMDKKIISEVKINAMILDHDEKEFADNVRNVKKLDPKKAYLLERKFFQQSLRRKVFIKNLITRIQNNTLILFYTIEYGTALFEYLSNNVPDKDFYYLDGQSDKEKRAFVKKIMENTDDRPKILLASFGIFSTGINIKALMNIVLADSFKSDQIIRQSIGRGLRLHQQKSKLFVFDIVDKVHKSYNNIIYKQYISRKEKIYKIQQFPVTEYPVKI